MRVPTLTCVILLIAIASTANAAAVPSTHRAPAATLPAREAFHIYLLMGQSNMVGRDARTLSDQVEDPRVLALNGDGQWVVAREPMHAGGRGIGPGIPFAREMRERDGTVTVGLIPCAVGGSPLRRWVKGGDLYEKAVRRARLAAEAGVIQGVLWHQGESDSRNEENAASYQSRLTQMFRDLRLDLSRPELPIVVGQLGEFLVAEKYPHADTVRGAIRDVATALGGVGYADAAGLAHKGDKLHFSADAEVEFGQRYAAAMRESQEQATGPAAAATVDVWPAGRMPGAPATQPEAERSPNGDGFTRLTNVSRPTLTVFPAPQRDTPSPAVIVCPGGGYNYVVHDKEGTEVAAWLNRAGISALVLKYRVPRNRDGALQDLQRALSLTRARAADWNIDPKRLGILGFSAGGNLSAKASTRFDQRTYPRVDAVDEQSCRPDFAVLVYPAYLEQDGHVAPDLDLRANIPPTLIVHSEDDAKYVAGSKVYQAALDEAKVPNAFLLYQSGGHGYGLRCTGDARAWPKAALEWLHEIGVLPQR